ncbi:hypothetical protein E0H36_18660 [Rhizobium leguminosarum bv. viciae]|uniref:hypothetical protein n=1 Tax=Rhizobium leguminosarum TaxID=384 RepID=UPI0010319113|nr:hypothetical protein [Rhizobium leguminosarum]MBY5485174.1 transposase family protein [Rhizobium leguminosarum]TAY88110.1 hypothetical protein ELH83_09920 [Rhizobium leguminosarum]TBZ31263.1 hypothetical protein E0H36_18660 [Rhizobium leguminosarum bv. viciae]
MDDLIKEILSIHAEPETEGFARIPEDAMVLDLGIKYKAVSSDRFGIVLRRMDETNATISFTQAQFRERLNRPRDPLTIKPRYYSQANAKARIKGGTDELSALGLKDQETVIQREFFVRSILKREAEYREKVRQARRDGVRPPDVVVSRSPEPMRRAIAEIAREWQAIRINRGVVRPTYRNAEKQKLFEPSPSTVKRWVNLMEENDFNPICLKTNYQKDRAEHFTGDELVHLDKALKAACSTTRPNIADLHRIMEHEINEANKSRSPLEQLRVPDAGTLRNRFNDIPPMYMQLGRKGKVETGREWRPELGGIDVVRALERVELDDHSTNLQAILVATNVWQTLTKEQKKLVKKIRLWVSAAIDVASRSVVALHVSAIPPSLRSAMTALEMMTRSKTSLAKRLECSTAWAQGGTPEVVAVDSAVYFAHRPFRVSVNDAGMNLFLPPAGEAPMRGFIERWFRTLGSQMFAFFTGRTWGSVAEKGEYDSEAEASAIADQVATCLIRWVVDGYHNTPHVELNGATPNDMWFQLARDYGVVPGPTGALRNHLFGSGLMRVITKKGIRGAGLQFQSKQVQQIRRKIGNTPIYCRLNNHDLGSISVLYEGGWIEVPCVHTELSGVSIWKWLATTEKLRLFNKENASVSRPTMLATFAWLHEQADIARLEAGILSPILTEEDFERFEKKMDHVFDVVDNPIEGEPRPEGEWHPSDELFAMLGIQPVTYANAVRAVKKAAKEARARAEEGGRPEFSTIPVLTPRQAAEAELDEPVAQHISSIFGEE